LYAFSINVDLQLEIIGSIKNKKINYYINLKKDDFIMLSEGWHLT